MSYPSEFNSQFLFALSEANNTEVLRLIARDVEQKQLRQQERFQAEHGIEDVDRYHLDTLNVWEDAEETLLVRNTHVRE